MRAARSRSTPVTDHQHPFSSDRVADAADEYDADESEIAETLERVQEAMERTDDTYEFSSQHNYGWHDDDAYYLYGDGIWTTLREQLSLSEENLAAARAVHRSAMVDSAAERDRRDSLEEMFEEGNEPLVVENDGEGPPRFGQGFSV